MSRQPPIWTDRLIDRIIKERLQEEIKGDLHEYYSQLVAEDEKWKLIKYIYHIIQFLRPFAVKIPFKNSIIRTMIRMNLLVAIRNMKRNSIFSFINILGLSLGLAVCILIGIYIKDELSYDKHWKNSDRIYRVAADLNFDGNAHSLATAPAPMASSFKQEFPEIEKAGRMQNLGKEVIEVENEFFPTNGVAFSDREALEVLQLNYLEGGMSSLSKPGFAIIDASTAKRLYGSVNAVGETFRLFDITFEIGGVYEDIPAQTHFHYKVILSMENNRGADSPVWLSNNYRTYFLLDINNNYEALEEKFKTVYGKYFGPQLAQIANITWEEFEQSDSYIRYYLQPVESIHLNSNLNYEIEANGNIQYVYILVIAGIFVLVIAGINFMNISTAQSSRRAKEVGMKKVLGSQRRQLIFQFLTESLLHAFIAMVLAGLLTVVLLPYLNYLTGKEITHPFFGEMYLWVEVLLVTILLGLLAGIYPSFFLSSFRPIKILKGNLSLGMKGVSVRNALVVVQFVASVLLIFGSLVIYSQLKFYQNKSLGFDKEQILVIEDTHTLGPKLQSFRDELITHSAIKNATISSYLPIQEGSRSDSPLQPAGSQGAEDAVSMQNWRIDEHYIPTLGLELVAGRNFDPELASDSSAIIMNESAVNRFDFSDPVGEKVKIIGDFSLEGMKEFKIIGIVKDFHFESFKMNITPLALFNIPSSGRISVKFQANETEEVLAFVDEIWTDFNPGYPLAYGFMNQKFDAHYQSERKLATLFGAFAVFSIIIACLGLFGLASYSLDQRKKEIGVRKVLGASTGLIVRQQVSIYTKLLIIAFVIGLPAGGYLMSMWLNNFSYRTSIGFLDYLVPAVFVMLLAWLVVMIISYRAANKSPVTHLNKE